MDSNAENPKWEASDKTISFKDNNYTTVQLCKVADVAIGTLLPFKPEIHVLESTFKETNRELCSSYTTKSCREHMATKNHAKMQEKNEHIMLKQENNVDEKKYGLYHCNQFDQTTKNMCLCGPYISSKLLSCHKERCNQGKEMHLYPSIDSLSDISINACNRKWALC